MSCDVYVLTANKTLRPNKRDVLCVADVADCIVTLPKASQATEGKRVTLQIKTLSTSLGAQVLPQSGDTIHGTTITAAASKYVKNTAATDAVGDALSLISDGAGGWRIVSIIGTWAREA